MTSELARLSSGIEGLDAILGGGFIEGSSYIVQGEPGAGKTVFASQIAFAQASAGGQVLYATLLAESHERLFQSLSTLQFYDATQLGGGVTFVSVFQTLRDEGLDAVVGLLRKEIVRKRAKLLVVDGLLNARDLADSPLDVKTFVAELQGHAAFAGCTVLFLTSAHAGDVSPEHTMVDGVLELREEIVGARSARRLRVLKSRGSASLGGFHQFEVTERGISIYPRLESLPEARDTHGPISRERTPSGIAGLDAVLGGGLPVGSVTMVAGPSGSGKTTFGLSFLSAAAGEPALFFGFNETPARLAHKGESFGLDVPGALKAGWLEMIWNPVGESLLDALGHALLAAVRRRRVKRLFIDGLGGFERAAILPSRLVEFTSSLLDQLRSEGVTTIASLETSIEALPMRAVAPEFLSMHDNLISLRLTEEGSELRRSLAVVKMRDSAFDARVRLLAIESGGLVVADGIGAVGTATASSASSPEPRR